MTDHVRGECCAQVDSDTGEPLPPADWCPACKRVVGERAAAVMKKAGEIEAEAESSLMVISAGYHVEAINWLQLNFNRQLSAANDSLCRAATALELSLETQKTRGDELRRLRADLDDVCGELRGGQ